MHQLGAGDTPGSPDTYTERHGAGTQSSATTIRDYTLKFNAMQFFSTALESKTASVRTSETLFKTHKKIDEENVTNDLCRTVPKDLLRFEVIFSLSS